MPTSKYESVEELGIIFYFKYDKINPAILHIYARHLTSIDDALKVFFNARSIWNEQYQRYEALTETHGLYWFWRNEQKREITIITCFRTDLIF